MRDIRLGDDIDDFCVRCKRVMNHAVVSVVNAAAAKVRCRTCHSDHDYRNEQAPPPKIDPRKAALFNEVLKKVNPDAVGVDVDVDPDEVPELGPDIELGPEVEIEPEIGIEAEPDPEPDIVLPVDPADISAPKPKAKAKGKARK